MKAIRGTEIDFPITLEELQAISNELHGRKAVRFKTDDHWTGQKHMHLRDRIDRAIELLTSDPTPNNDDVDD